MVGAFIQRSKLVIPLIFVAIFIVPYWQLSTDDSGGFLLDTGAVLWGRNVISTVSSKSAWYTGCFLRDFNSRYE